MTESAERLGPDHAKVSDAAKVDLGEDSVEDITEEMHAHAGHDSLTTLVAREDCEYETCINRSASGTHK